MIVLLWAQFPPHDRAVWFAPGHDPEAVPGEGRRRAGEQVAGVARHRRVHGVSLDGRGAGHGNDRQSRLDERVYDALAPVRAPYVEARDRPYGQVIHWLQVPGVREPPQVRARGELAPADGGGAVEGEQAGRLPRRRELLEVVLVVCARPLAVAGTDAPVHAPASVRGSRPAEEVFECGPPRGGERADRDVHHDGPGRPAAAPGVVAVTACWIRSSSTLAWRRSDSPSLAPSASAQAACAAWMVRRVEHPCG